MIPIPPSEEHGHADTGICCLPILPSEEHGHADTGICCLPIPPSEEHGHADTALGFAAAPQQRGRFARDLRVHDEILGDT